MAICKHCGTEIEEGLESCPNCGQKVELDFGDFFEPDESLEEEAYNIFDAPDEFDLDSLLAKELQQEQWGKTREKKSANSYLEPEDVTVLEEPETEEMELAQMLGLSETDITEEAPAEPTAADGLLEDMFAPIEDLAFDDVADNSESVEEISGGIELQDVETADFFALDGLFEDIEELPMEESSIQKTEPELSGFEDLLAVSEVAEKAAKQKKEKKKKEKKEKKNKKSLWKRVFGNVPIDPSKVKPEPTPEELEAKKQQAAADKKAKAAEKKAKAEEKKQNAKADKEEKARQKALAKEEKKAKKLEEAKQILEEMQDSRINRVGATIVICLFAVCAFGMIFGSDLFSYKVSVNSAETSFNKALHNNVKYYTDAYNEIYGLKIKPEDQELSDKILTVMFVNKQLNSYNSFMVLEDYESALHSLLKGLQRYGYYYEKAIPLGIDRDMDFVRTQILKELEKNFRVSEDEAELLRSKLEAAGGDGMNVEINAEAAKVYKEELQEIIKTSGLLDK